MTKAEKAAMPRPLKLRALLAIRGIKHDDIVATLRQSDGRTLSRTMFSLWMNKGRAPARTSVEELKTQVVTFLRDEHVPEADIATAFEPEESNRIISVVRTNSPTLTPPNPEIKPVEIEMLTQHTMEHFGLSRNPFPTNHSDITGPEDVMQWTNNRYISGAMLSTARSGGLLAIVGASGSGKSVLRKRFILDTMKSRDDIRVIMPKTIDKQRLTASALCSAIIRDITPDVKLKARNEDQAVQVETALKALFSTGSRAVLIIEEAHDMTLDMMRYLKRFWEIETGWVRPLAIILIAEPKIMAKLDERQHPELVEFIRRCEIAQVAPIDDRIGDYLKFKFERAGVKPSDVYAADVPQAIFERLTVDTNTGRRSLCYPLVIGNLMVRAMNEAANSGFKLVDAGVIKETARV